MLAEFELTWTAASDEEDQHRRDHQRPQVAYEPGRTSQSRSARFRNRAAAAAGRPLVGAAALQGIAGAQLVGLSVVELDEQQL